MLHRCAGALALAMCFFQLVVPFCRPVGIVDEHQRRSVLQSGRLQFHGVLILPEKLLREDSKYRKYERNISKNIPGCAEVYATVIGGYRGNGGPAREPVASAVNLLEAHVWQHKLDGGRDRLPVDAQQL